MASAALDRLPAVDRARAGLPAKIAGGRDLTVVEAEQCRAVLELPGTSNEALLAAALMGGSPMLVAIAAATQEEAAGQPDPGPHTGSMVALIPTDVDVAELGVDDGLEPDDLHITLVFMGPADEIPPLARVEVVEAMEAVLATWTEPIVATFGHIGHLGDGEDNVVAVAYEVTSPAMHEFRAQLVEELTSRSVEWSDTWSFRPHMTISYLHMSEAEEQWPVGPVPNPVTLDMTKVMARFGEDHEEIVTIGTPQQPGQPVTAAAGDIGLPALTSTLNTLNGSLQSLDRETGVEIRTAIDLGWRSALDRVGRMATRTETGTIASAMAGQDPAVVAVSGMVPESLNVEALIRPAVQDTAAHVARVAAAAQVRTSSMIADAFDVDLTDVAPPQAEVKAQLEDRLMDELLFRLGVLSDVDRIDPTNDVDPLVPPYQIARDTLAVAGGADLADGSPVRDTIGRPTSAGVAGSDSISLGPGPVVAIRDSIMAWGPAVTAAATRRPAGIRIPADLSADLGEAAARMAGAGDGAPLEQVTVNTWRLNYNGRAIENLPRHEQLAGMTITAEAELADIPEAQTDPGDWPGTAVSHPGDHRYCHCGWETRVELRPIQLAIPV